MAVSVFEGASSLSGEIGTNNGARSMIHAFSSSPMDEECNSCQPVPMTTLPKPADPLGEALHFLRMSGVFYCRSEFTAPWGLALPPFEDCVMFHVVTAGECWIEVDGADPYLLRPGELLLVPHGTGHRLTSKPGSTAAKLFDLEREQVGERFEILRHGGGGTAATAICGVVQFETPAAKQLVRLLPKLIVVNAWGNAPETEWLQSTLRFMADEARESRAGGETVITRLADILVVQAIRAWIARDPAAKTGWLAALQDKQIGRAIAAIHRRPDESWTLPTLAAHVGMSRSAFALRFSQLVGEPAMRYVTRWKMQTAQGWLAQGDLSIGAIATRMGYDSEAAFSRTFKRITGIPPGAARRSAKPAS
jgi:AraC-like DNA-binding protein